MEETGSKMEAKVRLKNCPMSARKMRLVVDQIRGRSVEDALNIARFSTKEAGTWIEKILLSAIANWENKGSLAYSAADYHLMVKTAFVDEGTMLKRYQPAPQGRAHRIRKRTNHVTLVVENSLKIDNEDSIGLSEEE